jgi:hypothetical protein
MELRVRITPALALDERGTQGVGGYPMIIPRLATLKLLFKAVGIELHPI